LGCGTEQDLTPLFAEPLALQIFKTKQRLNKAMTEKKNIQIPKYQMEAPSSVDEFVGNGHEAAAEAIWRVLELDSSAALIGLEGDLGAGKSTVISILEKKLEQRPFKFKTFDVDSHSHSKVKATLIKRLHKDLISINEGNEEAIRELDRAKDKALGNTLKYQRTTNSNIKWPVIIFLITIMLSVRYGVSAISDLGSSLAVVWQLFFGDLLFENVSFSLDRMANIVAGFSSLITLLYIKLKDDGITLGNLFNRNGTDTISETFDVTREVGSVELEEALLSFVGAIPEDETVVLVIDNIDRVEADKVREIWSDLSILSTLGGKKLRIIVPFSELHIAKALSDEDDESYHSGREYIVKRLPLIFRTPPVITAGWQAKFVEYWEESIPFIDGCAAVSDLIEIWKTKIGPVTPRFLKRVINEVAGSYVSCPQENIHGLCCAVYHLVYKKNSPSVKIEDILSRKEEALDRELKETYELMDRNFVSGDDWAGQIACLHYQTTLDIARSELLREPIVSAYKAFDGRGLYELSGVIGFDIYFRKAIEDSGSEDSYNLVWSVFSDVGDDAKEWVCKWLPDINSKSVRENGKVDRGKADGFISLAKAGFDVDIDRLKNDFQKISNRDEVIDEDNIDWAYLLSETLSVRPKFLDDPTAEEFYALLWPRRSKYENWVVSDIRLSSDLKNSILSMVDDEFDAGERGEEEILSVTDRVFLLRYLSSNNNIDGDDFYTFSNFQEDGVVFSSPIQVEIFPYSSYWTKKENASDLISRFLDFANKVNGKSKDEDLHRAIAAVVSFGINHNILNEQFSVQKDGRNVNYAIVDIVGEYVDSTDGLVQSLSDFMTFNSFGKILESLTGGGDAVSGPGECLSKAVASLILSGRVGAINIGDVINNYYGVLVDLMGESRKRDLLSFLSGWKKFIEEPVEDIPHDFVFDSFECEAADFEALFISRVESISQDENEWERVFKNPSINHNLIAENMRERDACLKNSKIPSNVLAEFVDVFFLVPEDARDRVISLCYLQFLRENITTKQREKMVMCFGDSFSLPIVEKSIHRAICVELAASNNSAVVQWLDRQSWPLDDWSQKELRAFKSSIDSSHGEYKKLPGIVAKRLSKLAEFFERKKED